MRGMEEEFSGFYKLTVKERLGKLKKAGFIGDEDEGLLLDTGALKLEIADRMAENVIGAFHFPFAVAPNFRINGKDYLVPMVIEEPSVVAAASKGAKLARESGGFRCSADEPIMMGQVQLVGVDADAEKKVKAAQKEIAEAAREFSSGMEKFGGGFRAMNVRTLETPRGTMLLVEFDVDVRDAMGANTINTVLEGVAPLIAEKSGGKPRLRILSNLATKRKARAKCIWKKDKLGEEIIEGVLDGYELAANDIFRCATHNKGIMNGVDAVAVATGNDWRAVEAGAHSFAAMGGYHPLTKYSTDASGNLVGEIELPLAVGTVGGAININPLAQVGQKILGAKSAQELSMVMASVGLAQNFAALRALGTEGIQKGHMKLHARNLAAIAGAETPEEIDAVAGKMGEAGEYTADSAKRILKEIRGE